MELNNFELRVRLCLRKIINRSIQSAIRRECHLFYERSLIGLKVDMMKEIFLCGR